MNQEWSDHCIEMAKSYKHPEALFALNLYNPADMLSEFDQRQPYEFRIMSYHRSHEFRIMSYHLCVHVPFVVYEKDQTHLFGLVRGKYVPGCLPTETHEPIALLSTCDFVTGVTVAFYRNHFWDTSVLRLRLGQKSMRVVTDQGCYPAVQKPDPLFDHFAEMVSKVFGNPQLHFKFGEVVGLFEEIERIAQHHGDIGLEMYLRMVRQKMLRGKTIKYTKFLHNLLLVTRDGFQFYGDFKIVAILMLQ